MADIETGVRPEVLWGTATTLRLKLPSDYALGVPYICGCGHEGEFAYVEGCKLHTCHACGAIYQLQTQMVIYPLAYYQRHDE